MEIGSIITIIFLVLSLFYLCHDYKNNKIKKKHFIIAVILEIIAILGAIIILI